MGRGVCSSLFLEMRYQLGPGVLAGWAARSSLSLLPFSTCRSFSVSFAALALVKKRMPPKKAPVQEKKVLLGRPSNNLKIGIVGTFIPISFRSSFNTFAVP